MAANLGTDNFSQGNSYGKVKVNYAELYVRKDTWEQRQKAIDERCATEQRELCEFRNDIKASIDELKEETKANKRVMLSALVFVITTLVAVLTAMAIGLFK